VGVPRLHLGLDRLTKAHLPFVNPQRETTGWVVTDPELERNVVALWSVVRQRQEHTFAAPLTSGPLFVRHEYSPLRARSVQEKFESTPLPPLSERGLPWVCHDRGTPLIRIQEGEHPFSRSFIHPPPQPLLQKQMEAVVLP